MSVAERVSGSGSSARGSHGGVQQHARVDGGAGAADAAAAPAARAAGEAAPPPPLHRAGLAHDAHVRIPTITITLSFRTIRLPYLDHHVEEHRVAEGEN